MICVTLLFMRKELLTGVLLVLFASCAQRKVVNTSFRAPNQEFEVRIVAQIHKPYCGGARPIPEMERGVFEPIQQETFYIKQRDKNSENSRPIASFTTNDEGKAIVLLPAGVYSVLRQEQIVPFDEFYKPYSANRKGEKTVRYKEEACFREWYETPELTFTVENKNVSLDLLRRTHCFIGANPCAIYEGPYPP